MTTVNISQPKSQTQTQTQKQQKQKQPKQKKNNRRRRIRSRRITSIPAAYSSTAGSYANLATDKDGSIRLNVAEIFYINNTGSGLTKMIPGCPTKWSDTRTASLARNYTSYRPTRIHIEWQPGIATATPGYVAIGSVYNGGRVSGDDNDVETMTKFCVASSGGIMGTAWRPLSTTLPLGRNLSKNTYPTYQVSELDDIPFWILFVKSHPDITGYIRVVASYTLRNPIVGIQNPPISGNGTASFVNSDTGTTMTIPKSSISGIVTKGQQILFTTAQKIVNKVGDTICNILGGFIAQLTGTADDNYTFAVPSDYATQTATAYVVGRHENF